jgi:hypothetical protein
MHRHPEKADPNRTLGSLSVVVIVALGLLWLTRLSRTPLFARLTGWAAATTRWAKLPWPLGLVTILLYRNRLRRENLYDTEVAAAQPVNRANSGVRDKRANHSRPSATITTTLSEPRVLFGSAFSGCRCIFSSS